MGFWIIQHEASRGGLRLRSHIRLMDARYLNEICKNTVIIHGQIDWVLVPIWWCGLDMVCSAKSWMKRGEAKKITHLFFFFNIGTNTSGYPISCSENYTPQYTSSLSFISQFSKHEVSCHHLPRYRSPSNPHNINTNTTPPKHLLSSYRKSMHNLHHPPHRHLHKLNLLVPKIQRWLRPHWFRSSPSPHTSQSNPTTKLTNIHMYRQPIFPP